MIDNARELFLEYLVRQGYYKSKERFLFRARQVFGGLDLKDKTVLEIGSGEGFYSIWAALSGARSVVGLEPEVDGSTPGSSSTFTTLIGLLHLENTHCVDRGIENFDPRGVAFDIVFSNSSINHWNEGCCKRLHAEGAAAKEYEVLFKKIRSLTAQKGKVLILDNSRFNLFGLFGSRSPFCPAIDWKVHQSPRQWIRLFENAGFCLTSLTWPARYTLFSRLYVPQAASFLFDSFFRIEMEAC